MPKVSFEVPSDIKDIVIKHKEINWGKVVSSTLWDYIRKIKILESITAKSRLTSDDIEALDHEIKADMLKKYPKTS
ncbi:MAG: hypothetical protein NT055_03955 [Nitrospirae bacterium]|nr:hypothetical protein [Nitrospirota bacterium]